MGDTPAKALAGNPLLRSHLLPEANVETLQALLLEAAATLKARPKDEKFYRALNATFFERTMTQELAGLPFGTYRYQLNTGLERVAESLWQRELEAKY